MDPQENLTQEALSRLCRLRNSITKADDELENRQNQIARQEEEVYRLIEQAEQYSKDNPPSPKASNCRIALSNLKKRRTELFQAIETYKTEMSEIRAFLLGEAETMPSKTILKGDS